MSLGACVEEKALFNRDEKRLEQQLGTSIKKKQPAYAFLADMGDDMVSDDSVAISGHLPNQLQCGLNLLQLMFQAA